MASYLLDTTVLIDYLRGRSVAVELLNTLVNQGHQIGVCCISVAELYAGVNEAQRAGADRLIDALDYREVSREIAKEAGRYRYEFARQGSVLSTADTLVAATAIAYGSVLVTANAGDFPMEELELLGHR